MITQKHSSIVGLDEVGRGAFAGPIVAAAVLLHTPFSIIQHHISVPIRDSKTLSKNQREKIANAISLFSIEYSIEMISVDDINTFGIGWANTQLFLRLFKKIKADQYIVDGNLAFKTNTNVTSIVDGDATVPECILAGIIAKVHRDTIMSQLDSQFPLYGWNTNVGYGTQKHRDAIKTYGICIHHRTQFVRKALSL